MAAKWHAGLSAHTGAKHRFLIVFPKVCSVANETRQDVREFLALAAAVRILPQTQQCSLAQANQLLCLLKHEKVRGANDMIFIRAIIGKFVFHKRYSK